jgi:hypothetical protein
MVIPCGFPSCPTAATVRLDWGVATGIIFGRGTPYCGWHAAACRRLFFTLDRGAVPTVMATAVATGGRP